MIEIVAAVFVGLMAYESLCCIAVVGFVLVYALVALFIERG